MILIYRILINLVLIISPLIILFRLFVKKEDCIRFREKLGFFTTGFFTTNDMSLNWMLHYKHCLFSPTYPNKYPIDGWVLKINDYKLQQTRPDYWQMAIKHYG